MFTKPPTIEKMVETVEMQKKQHWPTRFGFLSETKGLRRGYITGILGTTSAGKSTLLKSIVVDTCKVEKVLVYLSEETGDDYSTGIACVDSNFNGDNIYFFSEKIMSREDRQTHFKNAVTGFDFLKDKIIRSNCPVVFIDNLTTSAVYKTIGVNAQEHFIAAIGNLAQELNIAIVYLLHTDSRITEGNRNFIEGENVRGNKQAFIGADYFYIMQRFPVGNTFFCFIRIRKHRFSPIKNIYYKLHYENYHYEKDSILSFETINESFSMRNYLGRSEKKEKKSQYRNWDN
jgi:hypothetical protein